MNTLKNPIIFSIMFFCLMFIQNTFAQITYVNTGKLNVARWNHQSQVLLDGTVLVFGGDNGYYDGYSVFNSTEIYNPSTGSWTYGSSMIDKRSDFSSVILSNGNVMAIGGSNYSSGEYLTSCEIYNTQTKTWSSVAPMQYPRYNHMSVLLNNGKVLVAGGLGTPEIYDPITNTWHFTSKLNQLLNISSLTKLPNGKVVAVYGKKVEIFDPELENWTLSNVTLTIDRNANSAIALNNGKVLFVGSNEVDFNKQISAEIFDPVNGTTVKTPAMKTNLGQAKAILLDNGNPLFYSIGDFFSPTDTKCIQYYDVATNTWQSPKTNFVGANIYQINKLHNGKILISGGSFTTLNGSSPLCLLLNQTGYNNSNPNLSSTVSGDVICYGKSANVTISNTDGDASYQLCLADGSAIGNIVQGGGTIIIPVNSKNIFPGINKFLVKAQKTGGLPYFLNNVAIIQADYKYNIQTAIDSSGLLTMCPGGSVELNCPTTYSSYLWNTGNTSNQITVNSVGAFSVTGLDADGCAYKPSKQVFTTFYPTTINAGLSESVCFGNDSIELKGFSPSGGTWTGSGVTSDGFFVPNLTPNKSYTITYNLCSKTAQKTMYIYPLPGVIPYTTSFSKDKICQDQATVLSINTSDVGTYYTLMLEDSVLSGPTKGTGSKLSFTVYPTKTTEYQIKAVKTTNCGVDSTIQKDTVFVDIYSDGTQTYSFADTICESSLLEIKVTNSLPTVQYYINSETPVNGNGGDLVLKTPYLSNTPILYAKYGTSCTKNLFSKTLVRYDNSVDFDVNFGYLVGESVNIKNKSFVDSYIWKFDDGVVFKDVKAENPPVYSYPTEGIKRVTLIGNSRFNCADTITKEVNVYSSIASKTTGSLCYVNNINLAGKDISATHTDNEGNLYVASFWRLDYNGGNYSGSYLHAIQKFDKSGNLIWNLAQDFFANNYSSYDYYSSYINAITTDNTGNVYVAGNYTSDKFKFAGLTAETYSSRNPTPFIAKIDQSGKGVWLISEGAPGTIGNAIKEMGCSDIKYVDDNHIYVSIYNANKLKFTDGTTQLLTSATLNIVQIDKDGKFKNKNTADVSILAFHNPDLNYYYTGKTRASNPKMHILSNGKILVYGKIKKTGSFGSKSVTVDATDYGSGFVAVLNPNTGWENAFKTYGYSRDLYNTPYAGTYLSNVNNYLSVSPDENYIYVTDGFIKQYSQSTPPHIVFTFPGGIKDSSNYSGNFIAKYSIQGAFMWKNYSNSGQVYGMGYSNATNEIIRYGSFNTNYFGQVSQSKPSVSITSKGGISDMYLSSISENGNMNWIESLGGTGIEIPSSLVINSCNDITLLGYTDTKMNIMGETVYRGSGTHFYARISPSGQCNTTCNSNIIKPLTASLFTELPTESNVVPYPLKVVFNNSVSNFTSSDISVTNAQITGFSGSGKEYVFYVLPTNTSDITVQIPENIATDANGKSNSISEKLTIKLDTIAPTINISKQSVKYVKSSTVNYTLSFPEYFLQKTLSSNSLILHNCSVVSYNSSSSSGTLVLAPINQGPFYFQIPDSAIQDRAGNYSVKVFSDTLIYDNIRPEYSVANCGNTVRTTNNMDTLTITFSEKIKYFTSNLIFTSSGVTARVLDQLNDTTYRVEVTLPKNGCHYIYFGWSTNYFVDLAGNTSNVKCQINYCYDTVNPAVSSITSNGVTNPTPTKDSLINVLVKFTETIEGFDISDLEVGNANIVSITPSTSVPYWYDIVLKPIDNGLVTLKVKANSIQDLVGLENLSESAQFSIMYDKSEVTVHLTSDVPVLTNTSFVVNFNFSKSVTGFTTSDIYIANGTLSSFTGSGSSYKVTVKPTNDGTVFLYVYKDAAADASGNLSLISDTIHTQYDGTNPTFSLESPITGLTRIDTYPITLIFNEPVVGFDSTKITLTNATMENFSYSNDTCYFTLKATNIGLVNVSLSAGKVTDLAGNINYNKSLVIKYQGDDYTNPEMWITPQKDTTNSSTILFDIKLSENVYPLYSSTMKIINGTFKKITKLTDTTYTLEVSASKNGFVKVYVLDSAYQDIAFNPGKFADTAKVWFDNTRPYSTFVVVESDTLMHQYIKFKVVFSEKVRNVSLSAFYSNLGTFDNLVGSDSLYYIDFYLDQIFDSCIVRTPNPNIFYFSDINIKDLAGNFMTSYYYYNYCFPNKIIVTNTSEIINKVINIYPNPVNDFVNIEYDGMIKNIEISNALGQQVFYSNTQTKNNLVKINVAHLISGVYFIKIQTEDGVVINKIIKEQ
jgi:hypothetical protein